MVITTDGMENASRKYTHDEVKKMINKKKEERGWEFLFLAANIDAVESAGRIGIEKDRAVNYSVKEETVEMFEELGEGICASRICGCEMMSARIMEENIRKRKNAKK
jgi:hypothetical protein